jgi:hypothetical protein
MKYTGAGRLQRKILARTSSGRHTLNALRLFSQAHSLKTIELRVKPVKKSVSPNLDIPYQWFYGGEWACGVWEFQWCLFRPKDESKRRHG